MDEVRPVALKVVGFVVEVQILLEIYERRYEEIELNLILFLLTEMKFVKLRLDGLAHLGHLEL